MIQPQIIGFDDNGPPPRNNHPFRFWLLFVLSCLGTVWFYIAPYITFYQLKDAAKRKDTEELSELVNFPSVRESIKDALRAGLAQATQKEGGFAAALGILFGGVLIDSAVDVVVSPNGLEALSRGKKPDLKDTKLPTAKIPPSNRKANTEVETSAKTEAEQDSPLFEEVINGVQGKTDMTLGYDGFSKFSARWAEKDTGRDSVVLILRRENILWWRLTDVRMPMLFDGGPK